MRRTDVWRRNQVKSIKIPLPLKEALESVSDEVLTFNDRVNTALMEYAVKRGYLTVKRGRRGEDESLYDRIVLENDED